MSYDRNVYLVRELLLLCATSLYNVASGVILAFPSVLNPAILGHDGDIKATPDQASWIAASHGIAGLVGFIIISPIFEFYGRKTTNIVMNLFIFCGCFMFYVADDVYSLVFARLAQGLSAGGNFISIMTLCECTSPKRRGYFVVINKIGLALGSLACHSLGFFMDWRKIATLNALPSSIAILLFVITAESPSFYANQRQFTKCEKAFKWYRGNSPTAKTELKELVSAQMQNIEATETEKELNSFKKTMRILKSNDFRKSFLIVTLATLCLDSCGRYFLLAYLTQILVTVTKNNSLAMYTSVLYNCIFIIALSVSCITVKHFKRRTLLFTLGFVSVGLMFLVSLTIVLRDQLSLVRDATWLLPTVILLHTFVTNVGLVPIALALIGEVFSLEQKGVGSFVSGIVFITFFTLIMKLTPLMIDTTGVEGTYSIYGICLLVCLVLLRMILPETKDKTLQQIEDEIKGIKRINLDTEPLKNPNSI